MSSCSSTIMSTTSLSSILWTKLHSLRMNTLQNVWQQVSKVERVQSRLEFEIRARDVLLRLRQKPREILSRNIAASQTRPTSISSPLARYPCPHYTSPISLYKPQMIISIINFKKYEASKLPLRFPIIVTVFRARRLKSNL